MTSVTFADAEDNDTQDHSGKKCGLSCYPLSFNQVLCCVWFLGLFLSSSFLPFFNQASAVEINLFYMRLGQNSSIKSYSQNENNKLNWQIDPHSLTRPVPLSLSSHWAPTTRTLSWNNLTTSNIPLGPSAQLPVKKRGKERSLLIVEVVSDSKCHFSPLHYSRLS